MYRHSQRPHNGRPVRVLDGPAPGGAQLTLARLRGALDDLDVRYLIEAEGSLLAVWARHAMLFTVEGPADEILVIRARAHATVAPERADRAYRTVNDWNRTRRFGKAYVGDPMWGGQLPVYAELQVSLEAGIHGTLLVELLECGAAAAASFVDWLHGDSGLL